MEGLLWLSPLISGVGKLWEDCQEILQTPCFLRGRGRWLWVLRSDRTRVLGEQHPARGFMEGPGGDDAFLHHYYMQNKDWKAIRREQELQSI